MDVRVSRASAVVVQRVPQEAVDWYLEWQQGVAAAATAVGGFRGTDLYQPPPSQYSNPEWVAVLHFDDETALQRWLASPVRAEWVAKLRARIGDFDLRTLRGGFGTWFLGQSRLPPPWKMALTVLLGLYPTVMLQTIFLSPHTLSLGLAVAVLIGNALSVALLQWAVMPLLTRVLGPWLRANGRPNRAMSLGELGLLLLALGLMVLLFRQVTG